MDRSELLRRLPEIERVEGSLKRRTISAFQQHCPEYFWERPAASSHHPVQHRKERGLWLHTKRVFTAYERKARSFLHQDRIDQWEVSAGRAATLLHDIFKYGQPPDIKDHTVPAHDRLASEHLAANTDLPEPVIRCIDRHSGPWDDGDSPKTDLEQLVHLADLDASDPNLDIAVYKPCQELTDAFPELRRASFEPASR